MQYLLLRVYIFVSLQNKITKIYLHLFSTEHSYYVKSNDLLLISS